jgi:glycosyltransferase involved in cell wall biosynthesis
MKKTLAIDCSKLNSEYKTGTHRFLVGFLNELVKNSEYDFYFFTNGDSSFLKEFNFTKKGSVIEVRSVFYTQIGLLNYLNQFDYFIFPWQTLPFLGFLSKKTKVSIIHDTGFSFKTKITTFLTQVISNKIYSVSESTAKKLFRSSVVLGEGVDNKIFFPIYGIELRKKAKDLDIPNFFILSLGRIEKRKNIYNNLKSFAKVKKFYPNLKYVFIGKFVEDEEKIYSFISSLGLTRADVLFKKNINDTDLNYYLNSMEFLVFTSLEEGFGLPVLESYAVQKPVLLSKIEQLAEFKISANQLVNPLDSEEIYQKMILFLNKEHGITNKKEFKGILSKYSWKKSAEIFIKGLE